MVVEVRDDKGDLMRLIDGTSVFVDFKEKTLKVYDAELCKYSTICFEKHYYETGKLLTVYAGGGQKR